MGVTVSRGDYQNTAVGIIPIYRSHSYSSQETKCDYIVVDIIARTLCFVGKKQLINEGITCF